MLIHKGLGNLDKGAVSITLSNLVRQLTLGILFAYSADYTSIFVAILRKTTTRIWKR